MVEKKETPGAEIGEEEAELYDRQIRLWGLAAQNRLRNAKVLLVGMGGLGAEVAKNLVLAGLESFVLCDHNKVTAADAECQFLAPTTALGENRAEASLARTQGLNPMVSVSADTRRPEDIDEEMVGKFSLVIVTGLGVGATGRLASLCRSAGVAFVAGDVRGHFSFVFADLGPEHRFADETKVDGSGAETDVTVEKDGEPAAKKRKPADGEDQDESRLVESVESFVGFDAALGVDWAIKRLVNKARRLPQGYLVFKSLWSLESEGGGGRVEAVEVSAFEAAWAKAVETCKTKTSLTPDTVLKHLQGAFSPVCAVAGGVLAQEVIKAVSLKDRPLNNFFFFDSLGGSGAVAKIPPL